MIHDVESGRDRDRLSQRNGAPVNSEDPIALRAVEMVMVRPVVGFVSGLTVGEDDRRDRTRRGEELECSIDGGEAEVRLFLLRGFVDLHRRHRPRGILNDLSDGLSLRSASNADGLARHY